MISIVDATLLADVATLGPRTADARRVFRMLRSRRAMAAPVLLAYELGHILHGRGPYSVDRAVRSRQREALLSAVRLEPTEGALADRAARLAEEHALTFYDAAYLAHAEVRPDALFVTEDRQLARAARRVLGAGRVFTSAALARRSRAA